jgi:hypothetical protein
MNKTQTPAATHCMTCVYDAARRKAGDARDTAYAAAERSIWPDDDSEEAFVAHEAARDLRTAADATYAVANDDALWAYMRSLAAISK